MTSRVAIAAAVLATYAALVTWLTWPLGSHLATDLPLPGNPAGRADAAYAAWVLAHETHALSTAPLSLLDANIYHPEKRVLFYGPTAFGALPYFAPTFLVSGNPTLALNLTLLVCFVLTAGALHLVARRWTGSHLAGFAAGWAFLTNRWVLWGIPLIPHYAALQYLPLIVWMAATPASSLGKALWLAPLVVLQCLAEPVYVAPAVAGPLGVLALVRTARRQTRAAGLRLFAALAAAGLLLLPVYAGHLAILRRNPGLAGQSVWAGQSLTAFPPVLPWDLVREPAAVPNATLVLIAAGGLLFLWLAWRRREGAPRAAWGHALFWTLLGLTMALPPAADWLRPGNPITVPQVFLDRWTPLYDVLRKPSRLGVGATIGLALLAGLAFAECARLVPGRVIGRAVLLLLVGWPMLTGYRAGVRVWGSDAPGAPEAYPLMEPLASDSALTEILRQSDRPLLEVPLGTDNTRPVAHAAAMYHSIYHWRPLLNGYSSYYPAGFRELMALAERLPDPEAVALLRRETGLAHVLVHVPPYPGPKTREWYQLANRGGRPDFRLVARDGRDFLFAVGEP